MTKHPIKRLRQLFELVPGANIRPLIQISPCNRVTHLFQMQHGLYDDIADNHIRGRPSHGSGDNGCREQHRIIPAQFTINLCQWIRNLDDPQDIIQLQFWIIVVTPMTIQTRFGSAHRSVVPVLRGIFQYGFPESLHARSGGLELFNGIMICQIGWTRCGIIEIPCRRLTHRFEQCPTLLFVILGLQIFHHRREILMLVTSPLRILGMLGHDRGRNKILSDLSILITDDLLCLLRIKIKTSRDQQQQSPSKQQTTLSFQTGLAQQSFQCAIRHRYSINMSYTCYLRVWGTTHRDTGTTESRTPNAPPLAIDP